MDPTLGPAIQPTLLLERALARIKIPHWQRVLVTFSGTEDASLVQVFGCSAWAARSPKRTNQTIQSGAVPPKEIVL